MKASSPGFFRGALVSLLLLAPLTALNYLAAQLFTVPFVPYGLFEYLTRVLPGPLITRGIDTMVAVMNALSLPVADLAKTAEQGLAVAIFLLLGVLVGALFFALFRATRTSWAAGLLPGFLLGVPLAVGVSSVSGTGAESASPPVAGIFTLALLALYGVLLALAKRRLTPSAGAVGGTDSPTVQALNRRQFMVRVGGAAAVITVVGAGIGAALGRRDLELTEPEGAVWSASNALPNAGATPQPAPGTRPELTPLDEYYRIDINLTPPVVREETWRLRVEGLVETPKEYTLGELRAYEPVHQFITMACISNTVGGPLTSTTRWTGVPVQRLLEAWGVQDSATHLRISSADGFFEYVALDTIRSDARIMLAYEWDGVPLRIRNGFPLRVYIPDVYGMKQPKWIETIEAVDAWAPGYWVRRTWDRTAQMRAVAVIDTVATDAVIDRGGEQLVPIGGMAHAGARGVSRVEVKVDDGVWQEAQLREPISKTTWTLWRFDWPFVEGEHTFTVRCFEGDGTEQISERRPPHPSGATGLNSKQARI